MRRRRMRKKAIRIFRRFSRRSFYLLALARTAAEIDEEVFDHKMNLVMQYRKVLKKNLSVFESWDPDSVKRIKESIRIACENRMLLREKYEDYIGEM